MREKASLLAEWPRVIAAPAATARRGESFISRADATFFASCYQGFAAASLKISFMGVSQEFLRREMSRPNFIFPMKRQMHERQYSQISYSRTTMPDAAAMILPSPF